MKKLLERDIQKQILDYLSYKKIFHYKQSTTGIYKQKTGHYIPSQSVGAGDIVIVINGRHITAEIKRPGSVQTPAQRAFQQNLEAAGGIYKVIYSLDDLISFLKSDGSIKM